MAIRFGMMSMAHVHAEGYASELEKKGLLAAIYDEDEGRGREAAKKHVVEYFPDLDAFFDRVDAVLIASPTNLHLTYVKEAASRGKHVLVEKPLAFKRAEAEQMVSYASRVTFGICFGSRLSPINAAVKGLISAGTLGRVTFMRIRVAHSAALDKWFPPGNWFIDKGRSGGGGLLDLGVHGVDLLYWLKGEPPTSVTGMTSRATSAYEIDDEGALIMAWPSGTMGVVEGAWTQRAGFNFLEVYGDLGTAVTGLPGHQLYANIKGEWRDWPVEGHQISVIEDFVQAVESGRKPIAPGSDGVVSAAIMEAAYAAKGIDIGLGRRLIRVGGFKGAKPRLSEPGTASPFEGKFKLGGPFFKMPSSGRFLRHEEREPFSPAMC